MRSLEVAGDGMDTGYGGGFVRLSGNRWLGGLELCGLAAQVRANERSETGSYYQSAAQHAVHAEVSPGHQHLPSHTSLSPTFCIPSFYRKQVGWLELDILECV